MRSRQVLVAHSLFFLSGAAGLVYQVVWSRILTQLFGVSAHAVTVVLATFLGGLAIGAWLMGRLADRWCNPLRFYGWLEIGIAATAVAGTLVVRAFDPIHVWAATRFAPSSFPLLAIRIVLASAVILPPTFLMGGTLPAITRAFVDELAGLGRRLSLLYAVNTAGAVLGSLAAGFILIRAIGVHRTLSVAVAINVAIGATALLVARPAVARREARTAPADHAVGTRDAGSGAWLLTVIALSGFASLSLEVIWTRMLILVFGTSTYAFVTMLSTFLVGIALGSFIARGFVDRVANPRRVFGYIQLGIAASTMGSVFATRVCIPSAYRWLETLELHWGALTLGRFGLSFAIMIVPTTLVGMTFPIAARIWTRRIEAVAGDVGQIYGANTAGNIAGAILAGFVILPVLGMQRGIAIVTTLNLVAAAWALLPARGSGRSFGPLLRAAPISAGISACALLLVLWRPGPLPGTGGGPNDPVRFYREGVVSTVKVVQRADDGRQMLMTVDGITIGQSSTGVDRKQQVLAHLPFVLASPDRPIVNVLSIGLGTGILIGEMARHHGVEHVDCVELSPSVIDAARLFAPYNFDVVENSAVRIINDDGVNYLRRTPVRYDAIVSDGKSKSGHAGNAVFYSDDYYRSARDHLAPGGTMIQWVPLDVAPEDLRTIMRTFVGVFGHAYVWVGQDSAFLVGLDHPLVLDIQRAQRAIESPASQHLWRHGWRTANDVATLLVADKGALTSWLAREETINSLEHPVLEFYSMGALAESAPVRTARNLDAIATAGRAGLRDVEVVGADPQALGETRRAVSDFLDGVSALAVGEPRGFTRLRKAIAMAPGNTLVQQWGATVLFEQGRALDLSGDELHAIDLYREALRSWPEFIEARLNLGRAYSLTGEGREALTEYEHAVRLNPDSATAHLAIAELRRSFGDLAGAIEHGRAVVRIDPGNAKAHDDVGLSFAMAGQLDEALAQFRDAMRLAPDWAVPIDRAALLLATVPGAGRAQVDEAIRLASHAMKLTRAADPLALETLAAVYAAGGRFREAVAAERDALRLARASGNATLVSQITTTLDLYEHGRGLPPMAPTARGP